MTIRTFVMIAALIVLTAGMSCGVFEFQGCRTESRARRLVEEAAREVERVEEEAKAKLFAASNRSGVLRQLLFEAGDQEPSLRMDKLQLKCLAAMEGDRSDPKIEAMVVLMIAQLTDPSRTGEENANAMKALAFKLVRAYEP